MPDGNTPSADARFDVVIANQVFERVKKLEDALADIPRALKPVGISSRCFQISAPGERRTPMSHSFTANRWDGLDFGARLLCSPSG
jgi:ubiquinone/menaquinone biosynthesis C-methylase UbiE